LLGLQILQLQPIAGGDISTVYRIETKNQQFIVKSSVSQSANEMFQAEKNGLEVIRSCNTIKVPEVFFFNRHANTSFLIMEFVDSKRALPGDFTRLGEQVAELHKNSDLYFGWQQDNFIGSLPQLNRRADSWSSFFVLQRLFPQLKLAISQKLLDKNDLPNIEKVIEICESLFSPFRPALLHGDLWSGNYLISKEGIPFLIDPAVYYGHSEVDLAMTRLFGGFNQAFYDAYDNSLPPQTGRGERCELYQLYYLLVHLNLFGRSYYSSVKRIIDRYF
jgi:fructosamine-3-kinase